MGYYQGNGARKIVSNMAPSVPYPQSQPACLTFSATGLIDCGNWAVSASWTVPSTAVSGLYLAHLVRNDNGGSSIIPFVVRNDASHSDLLFQTSDETWQAYNTYGGNSLYSCTVACPPGNPGGYKGAFKVSYNRPFHTADDDQGRDWFLYSEYPMIRYLEANGYDVSYTSGLDVETRGSLLTNHKVFLSVGHDEYWSGGQRANVEAARAAGVNLAFFSGNEVFWKTRWESSADGSNTAGRTLVTYKETHFDAPTDPQDPPVWTGSWEDPRFSPPADGGRAQNALTGQLFEVNAGTSDIQVPAAYGRLRLWRNTPVASLAGSQVATLGAGTGTLGYEWDVDVDNGFRPAGLFDLSSTTVSGLQVFTDYGTNTATGTKTHHLTLYRASSGALVFGAGTVQWSWGLDSGNPSGRAPDPTMQQATVNLLADMGAQPATLLSGLVAASASTDTSAPTSVISSPTTGSTTPDGTSVTVAGTATDTGGGVVAGVEVSTDGGSTWHPATGTSTWTYSWVAHGSPSTVIKSRAVDDSGNVETPGPGVTVNVTCPCSIWGAGTLGGADSGDGSSIEVGVKFTSDTFGTVNGVRFYKPSLDTGTHVGDLWSASGQLLASATFTGETTSGWQQVLFSSPVPVTANTTYVASYFAPKGHYAETGGYFFPSTNPPPDGGGITDSPPLHALRGGGANGTNGVYVYAATSKFPNLNYQSENYWVDPVFTPSPAPGQVSGVNATAQYAAAAVAWTAPSGSTATSYTITPYVGTVAQASTTVSGLPAPTSALVTGLTNGTSYTFTVTASNPNGTGPASAPSNAVTPSASASAVVNGGFESGAQYWATGGAIAPSISTTQVHSGSNAALLGAVSGSYPAGDSWVSQTISVPPSQPTLTFWYYTGSADTLCTGSSCVYDWVEAQIRNTSGTTLASVLKLNSNTKTWTKVTFDLSSWAGQTVVLWFNVHQDSSSPPDDTYAYLDDVSVAGTGPTAPGAPTGVSAVAGNGSAVVSWTAPSSNGGSAITSYTVTPYINGVAQQTTTVSGNPPATSVTVSGLTNGTSYTFTVAATNAVGTGPASAASNAVTPSAPTVPGAPTGVSAVAGNGSAVVSWTAPSSNGGSAITSYTVTPYINGVAQQTTTVSGNPPATSVTVSGLTNGTSYTFTVAATNGVGTGPASAASNAVTPTAPTVPGAPTGVSATAGNASAVVSWTAPSSNGGSAITSYTVTPSINGVAQQTTTVSGNPPATSVTVSGLTNGTSYTFTVAATNGVGTGPASAASNAVTPTAPTVPGAPTGVSATAGNASAAVSWSAPSSNGGSSVTSYTVTPYVGGVAQSSLVTNVGGNPPATSVTIIGLTNGTTYTFTVSATNAVGTGPASAASNAVTPTAPTVPGAPTGMYGDRGKWVGVGVVDGAEQ